MWRLGEQFAFGWNEHTLGRTHRVGCSYYMHWQLFLHEHCVPQVPFYSLVRVTARSRVIISLKNKYDIHEWSVGTLSTSMLPMEHISAKLVDCTLLKVQSCLCRACNWRSRAAKPSRANRNKTLGAQNCFSETRDRISTVAILSNTTRTVQSELRRK